MRISVGTPLVDRIAFYSHSEPNSGCTLWSGPVCGSGYPVLRVDGRRVQVSRHILGLTQSSRLACHRCDNPNCVSALHLFIGTDKTNAEDRDRKGRHPGARQSACKHGHAFTEANTYVWRGSRHCRACNLAAKTNGGRS